jgi:hypothetical protein
MPAIFSFVSELRMGRWLKEPLLHFLVLGALIFLVYRGVAGTGPTRDQIFISKGQQENLLNTFSRTWQRAPTPDEFQGLLRDYIRQEIAYRESTSMGLDQDDIVIRRRLRQKLELLTEDVASLVAPTDPDLQQYLENHAGDFTVEPRLSLRHIYFSRDRRGTAAEQDARDLLQRIDATSDDLDPQLLGDPLPLPAEMTGLRESEVSRYFGKVFIDGLADLEPGQWSGPVESGFGLHLVIIDERVPARAPALEEVREAVQREWLSQRRQEAVDGLYDRLAENYTIEIESLLDIPATEGQ